MYKNIFYDRKAGMYCIWDDEQGKVIGEYRPYAFESDPEGELKTIYGENVSPVYTDGGRHDHLFESDVRAETRILIDTYLDSDVASTGHVILTLDIEVEMDSGKPNVMEGKNVVTSIAIHDSKTDKYTVYILDQENVVDASENGNRVIVPCDTEKSLLQRFLGQYEEIAPDILTGWFIDGFDIPYLYNRIKRLFGVDEANRLSPMQSVRYDSYHNKYRIGGISSLDYMPLYKKFTYKGQSSYSLDYISRAELGRGKVVYQGNLDQFKREDIQGFIDYNVTDVELVVELNKKLDFIGLAIGVCHIGHVPYEEIFMDSRVIDGAILTYLRRRGIVAPNKPVLSDQDRLDMEDDSKRDKFKGAYVKPPIPGRYKYVYDLDLTSLYPSIIMGLNISPETKVGKVENWDFNVWKGSEDGNIVVGGKEITYKQFRDGLESNNLSVSANGVIYTKKVNGIVPTILDEWFKQRVEFRALEKKYGTEGNKEKYEFYNRRQTIQKVLLNSVYGVLGLKSFRYYDVDNAEATTVSGQETIQNTVLIVNHIYNTEIGEHYTLNNGSNSIDVYGNETVRCGDVSKKGKDVVVGDVIDGFGTVTEKNVVTVSDHNRRNVGLYDEKDTRNYAANQRFAKLHDKLYDYNLYIDTDSCFFSAVPIIKVRYPDWRTFDDARMVELIYEIATEMQTNINKMYDKLSKRFFNVTDHRFNIKQEMIARTGLWVKKKRYAQHIIAKNGVACDEIDIKGLDMVRSSFPKSFGVFLNGVLKSILDDEDKEIIDGKILDFNRSVNAISVDTEGEGVDIFSIAEIASVNKLDLYTKAAGSSNGISYFPKGCSIHVKAAIAYNRLLKHLKCANKHTPIADGDKARYVYLKNNPYGFETISLKADGTDPSEIMEFVYNYVDSEKMYVSKLRSKVEGLYGAIGWSMPSEETAVATEFFAF